MPNRLAPLAAFAAAGLAAGLSLHEEALAQEPPPATSVEAIVVTAAPDDTSLAEARHAVSREEVARIAPSSAADILRQLPSAHVPVNSRGEALVFLRNAGERQVAVFYDGALLNVPWDNRIDLSMTPSNLVASVSSASGPISAQYGLNALGAVNLAPRRFGRSAGEIRAEIGTGEMRLVEGLAALRAGRLEIAGSVGHTRRSGEPLSNDPRLPTNQGPGGLRTNTDRELSNLSGRLGWTAGGIDLGLTAFRAEGEKGVAPEGDRGPDARFWRYPELVNRMAILRADARLGRGRLHVAGWAQAFNQTIDAYASSAFERIGTREEDEDRTLGARGVLTQAFGETTLVLSANWLTSTHDQRDIAYSDTGGLPTILPSPVRYRQRARSLGTDLQHPIGPISVELGAGYDWIDFPLTGDKPRIDGFKGEVLRAGLSWRIDDAWRLRAGWGTKARMPTLRDLFGNALNRFLVNPGLRPERIYTAELGLTWRGLGAGFTITPFMQRVEDTLDQRSVGRLRQRVNLRGSSVEGIEFEGEADLSPGWSAVGQLTLTRTRRRPETPTETRHIAEKPAALGRVAVAYEDPEGLELQAEAEHIGKAWSADPDGVLRALDASTQIHLRVAYNLRAAQAPLEVYLRVDNVTDANVNIQAGLPGPGRSIRLGARADF